MLRLENCVIRNGGFELRADVPVTPGARVAVIGPSGGGKTTLLEALTGFMPLSAGAIAWGGTDISCLPPGQRPVAMLFQDGNLFGHMTAAQNVGLGLSPDLRLSGDQHDQVSRALARVGLSGMEGRKPSELSGGQQSRVALARVLVQRRDILLLDEPFAALGPAMKVEMLDLVAELTHETDATLLMVSHDPKDAQRICEQVILVADTIAHPPEDTAELLKHPPQALRDYLGNFNYG